ncbi:protoporphyrinogen oxidase HemJ [uncultured Methylophaga sp.]|uniref:protoporphyrinogen oxidase HemJ n=1 Tax=uncultured Methylophaga sp. TaxID=285271 RepID=UPI000C10B361|nr:protoporphyrinogen oxidase HemJ [uncultured Methylophaga sp.]|tara:strand:- start:419 stop:844 length:426 start_codon:yes stop_codon:yes gene_type:complete
MLWVKAFHLMAVVTWFAALFYLPRLYVYHAMCEDQAGRERFKIMERKLYRGIMTPSAIVALVLGIWLMSYYTLEQLKSMHWLHAKLTLVVLLFAYHGICGRMLKKFAADKNQRSHVFYRWFNEMPVLILIAVMILAVVKPF